MYFTTDIDKIFLYFYNFKGKASADPCHPDYIPSVFVHTVANKEKDLAKLKRYERKKNRFETSLYTFMCIYYLY